MKLILTIFLSIFLTTSFADTTKNDQIKKKVRAEKDIKTNGKISTSGCETIDGKKINENDQGYAECIRQIGIKK